MSCDKLRINVWDLIKLANRHPRVNILNPGPGVGGHCIAVDPWFIVNSCPEESKLIQQARLTNDAKPYFIIDKICEAADQFKNPSIACLGLSFKADIDDLRESPAVQIVGEIAGRNLGRLMVVEPNISVAEMPDNLTEAEVELVQLEKAIDEANIVVVLVDHKEFCVMDRSILASKVVIDSRGVF